MRRTTAVAALALALSCPARALAWPFGDSLEPAQKLFDSGKYSEVISKLSPESMQRLSRGSLSRAYYFLGTSYERTSRSDRALGVYQLGVKLYPSDLDLLGPLGSLLHHAGLEEQAEPVFQRVLQIHPNNAPAHLGLAEIDRSLGFYERSAEHYEKALETMGKIAAVWRDYAEVLLAQRDTLNAELAIRRALELSPDAESRIDLAMTQRSAGRMGEALATLEQIIAADPARKDVALTRALWLLEADRFDEAAKAAESLLKESPEDPLGRFIRARVALKQDRYNQALKDLEAAAGASRRSPFVARASEALLRELKGRR